MRQPPPALPTRACADRAALQLRSDEVATAAAAAAAAAEAEGLDAQAPADAGAEEGQEEGADEAMHPAAEADVQGEELLDYSEEKEDEALMEAE